MGNNKPTRAEAIELMKRFNKNGSLIRYVRCFRAHYENHTSK